jgi:hypothetical protein
MNLSGKDCLGYRQFLRKWGIDMDVKKTKKELCTEYKEKKAIGGVYIIRNKKNSKILVEGSPDMIAIKNRFEFAQKMGSCVNMKIEKDWVNIGGENFEFEMLEEIEKMNEQTSDEFRKDVKLLKEMWCEKLKGNDFY